ncbi:MAG: SsrA-binding protein SmpB [Cyclobacteriaceae bacterium]
MAKDKGKDRFSNTVNIKNRKAGFEYTFIDKYVAGIVLQGTEIKSIKEGKASLQEAYCHLHNEEVYIKGMHIAVFSEGTYNNHEPLRERKLLLSKKEIKKIHSKYKEKGLAIVPTRLFVNNRGYAKLEIALAKGKKIYDKRDSIKDKDIKRELDRSKF